MAFRAAFAIALLAVAGCDINDSEPLPVNVRVENVGGTDFSAVTVRFGVDEAEFGPVAAGVTTDYGAFETASRRGTVTVEASDQTYRLSEVDAVGDDPLDAGGEYTLTLDVEGGALQAGIRRD